VILSGKKIQDHLSKQIHLFIERGVKGELAHLDQIHTFKKAIDLLRSIEEFINIPDQLSPEELKVLDSLSLLQLHPYTGNLIDKMLLMRFGKDTTNRFKKIASYSSQLLLSFRMTNENLGYKTILDAVAFYRAHRRHLTNLLYVIPKYCKGKTKYNEVETLLSLVHFSECYLRNVTSLHRQLVLSHIHSDYSAKVIENTIVGNYQFEILDESFLEPERMSITDPIMKKAFELVSSQFASVPTGKAFSLSEMLNECTMIRSYFRLFTHNDPVFEAIDHVVSEIAPFVTDDYFVSIPKKKLLNLLSKFDFSIGKKVIELMTNESDDFIAYSNSFHPFISVGEKYRSSVNLIMRFVYNYKNTSLNNCKQFQIKSGFLFEERVKETLALNGFQVLHDAKRIQRKEFDVVCLRENVIYNFQCKNNFVDITLIESNPRAFASKNRRMVSYYAKSIDKELGRQHLLANKYGNDDIRHFVISRFPVVTNNPSIILFTDLETIFRELN
jgi:hypothetical protein